MVIKQFKKRQEFRNWLANNHKNKNECWVQIKRGEPKDLEKFYYIDAVEEALCFGWIDSIHKVYKCKLFARFSPRKKNSHWTELNKERFRRLEKLGLMTIHGRKMFPKDKPYLIDKEIECALKKARVWSTFKKFPLLYQKIRISNILFYKNKNKSTYDKALKHLIKETKKGKMFGQWNDYGRLLNY